MGVRLVNSRRVDMELDFAELTLGKRKFSLETSWIPGQHGRTLLLVLIIFENLDCECSVLSIYSPGTLLNSY